MPRRRPDQGVGAYEDGGQVHKPSLGEKIVGHILTGAAGFGGGMGAAGQTHDAYFNRPYYEAVNRSQADEELGRRQQRHALDVVEALERGEDREERRADLALGRRHREAHIRGLENPAPRYGTPFKRQANGKTVWSRTVDVPGQPQRIEDLGDAPAERPAPDVKVGEVTGPDNVKRAKYRRSDGSEYTVEVGSVRPPAPRASRGGNSAASRQVAFNKAYSTIVNKVIADAKARKNARPADIAQDYLDQFGADLAATGIDLPKLRAELQKRFATPAPARPQYGRR